MNEAREQHANRPPLPGFVLGIRIDVAASAAHLTQ
jgi:hypothetical protein